MGPIVTPGCDRGGGAGGSPEAVSSQSRSGVTLCRASGASEFGPCLSVLGAEDLPSLLLVVPQPALPGAHAEEWC